MKILFLIALFLAWPTFGISIIIWFILLFLNAKENVKAIERREHNLQVIEPLFEGRFVEFFMALDIPIYGWEKITNEDAYQCGRHIMSYIAHNPEEAVILVQGLEKKQLEYPCDLITAAEDERDLNAKGEIHIVTYRAIEALITQNKIKCFEKIDLAGVLERQARLEIKKILNN